MRQGCTAYLRGQVVPCTWRHATSSHCMVTYYARGPPIPAAHALTKMSYFYYVFVLHEPCLPSSTFTPPSWLGAPYTRTPKRSPHMKNSVPHLPPRWYARCPPPPPPRRQPLPAHLARRRRPQGGSPRLLPPYCLSLPLPLRLLLPPLLVVVLCAGPWPSP